MTFEKVILEQEKSRNVLKILGKRARTGQSRVCRIHRMYRICPRLLIESSMHVSLCFCES